MRHGSLAGILIEKTRTVPGAPEAPADSRLGGVVASAGEPRLHGVTPVLDMRGVNAVRPDERKQAE